LSCWSWDSDCTLYYPDLYSAACCDSATFGLAISLFLHWGLLLNSWMALVFRRNWLSPWLLSILRDGNISLWGRDRRLHLRALPDHRVRARLSIRGNLSVCWALRVCFSTAAGKLGEGVKLIWVCGGEQQGSRGHLPRVILCIMDL